MGQTFKLFAFIGSQQELKQSIFENGVPFLFITTRLLLLYLYKTRKLISPWFIFSFVYFSMACNACSSVHSPCEGKLGIVRFTGAPRHQEKKRNISTVHDAQHIYTIALPLSLCASSPEPQWFLLLHTALHARNDSLFNLPVQIRCFSDMQYRGLLNVYSFLKTMHLKWTTAYKVLYKYNII